LEAAGWYLLCVLVAGNVAWFRLAGPMFDEGAAGGDGAVDVADGPPVTAGMFDVPAGAGTARTASLSPPPPVRMPPVAVCAVRAGGPPTGSHRPSRHRNRCPHRPAGGERWVR